MTIPPLRQDSGPACRSTARSRARTATGTTTARPASSASRTTPQEGRAVRRTRKAHKRWVSFDDQIYRLRHWSFTKDLTWAVRGLKGPFQPVNGVCKANLVALQVKCTLTRHRTSQNVLRACFPGILSSCCLGPLGMQQMTNAMSEKFFIGTFWPFHRLRHCSLFPSFLP